MKTKIKKIVIIAFFVVIALTLTMYWFDQYNYYFSSAPANDYSSYGLPNCLEYGNVALIKIHGDISTYLPTPVSLEGVDSTPPDSVSSEDIIAQIDTAEKDDYIDAVIIDIDSYGGSPVASEEIMNAVKKMSKTTIAVIGEGGVSGAYLIATGADKIYASEMSDVGSIGVTMSYLDYSQANKQDGIIYQQLSSGKFKDTGNPDKILTAEEKTLLMRDIQILHEVFIKKVSENRKLDIEKVRKLADGSTMLGVAAKENGLIDEIGNLDSAKIWLLSQFQIESTLCVY